ncbi:MAG: carboxyltransferase domain-containing protein [Alphaproteobacteria bacterium]|nr:carboxyltransferase domain-containing protein [Alphaproteobacteria bacterium]
MIFDTPRFSPSGDRYLLVQFGDDASLALNVMALALDAALKASGTSGIIDTVTCYNTLLVEYEANEISYDDLRRELKSLLDGLGPMDAIVVDSRLLLLPLMYSDPWTKECIDDYRRNITDRPYDPDYVAAINGLKDGAHLARVHSAGEHWVVTVGSFPGLPLLRPLDPRCTITTPKYNPPRTWTPQGALGLGGASSSIYTLRSPGGYQLIGRTPVLVFDPKGRNAAFKGEIVLLKSGDRVKFQPIGRNEFEAIEAAVNEGRYLYNISGPQKFSVAAHEAWAKSLMGGPPP